MIVTCERCSTQFQLDDARVPQRGVRVRCSRCKNSFRVVPEARRAAQEMAVLARRAREDSRDDITQDLAEDPRGDSSSRAGARAETRADEAGRGAAPPAQTGAAGGGLDAEESDWKFNEDVSGEQGERGGSGRAEPKPDPPLARSGAQHADDWFSGGGDTPLELDDRPWDAPAEAAESAAETPAEPVPAPEPFRTPPSTPPSPPPIAAAPAPQQEALETPERSQPPGAPTSTDELDAGSWDLLSQAEAEAAEAASSEAEPAQAPLAKPARSTRRLPSLAAGAAYLARWLGYGAQAFGWVVTVSLFGAGLHAGLATRAPAASGPERVAGLDLAALDGRFVENAVSGTLFVVSGRLRNPGPAAGDLAPLALELLDAAGEPLDGERAPLHAPLPTAWLRESPAPDLAAQPRLAGPIGPGEERAFEAVVAALPESAAAFRIVGSR